MATFIIGAVIAAALLAAAVYTIKNARAGKCVGCSGDCSGGGCACHSDPLKDVKLETKQD